MSNSSIKNDTNKQESPIQTTASTINTTNLNNTNAINNIDANNNNSTSRIYINSNSCLNSLESAQLKKLKKSIYSSVISQQQQHQLLSIGRRLVR